MSEARPGAIAEPRTAAMLHGVLRAIARAVLGDLTVDPRLGRVQLLPHQVEAAARLRASLRAHGGALLADEVGLGKTFAALAAARDARSLLVVAPAALLPMWRRAADAAEVRASLVSAERLGRPALPPCEAPDVVIVDEAHHFRNPATRRYRRLAAITDGAAVLLLTATPVHNGPRDARALLALFLGSTALALDDDAVAAHLVRRTHESVRTHAHLPDVSSPKAIAIPHDDRIPAAILALPPPIPARGAGEARALVALTLLRRWASSDAALRASLRRRLAAAEALVRSLEAGRHPSAAELRAWSVGDDAVQLAFPELVAPLLDASGVGLASSRASPRHGDSRGAPRLASAARRHARAVERLLARLRPPSASDAARADALREVRTAHAGERIVAFSQFADTVDALYALLARDGGVAALTARGGRMASGTTAAGDVLARFAPAAAGRAEPGAAERVSVLIATDMLSEGVDLRDASVVVHLDLPWTAARLEQRVGRARRLGSHTERVRVYALEPPASAERVMAIERLLARKLGDSARIVGVGLPATRGDPPLERGASVAELVEDIRSLARELAAIAGETDGAETDCPIALVTGERPAFVSVVRAGGHARIVASIDGMSPTTQLSPLREALRLARDAAARPVDQPEAASRPDAQAAEQDARHATERWLAEHSGATLAAALPSRVAPARTQVLRRIASELAGAPAHRRPRVAALAAAARLAVERAHGAGAEAWLAERARDPASGEAWLASLGDRRAVSALAAADRRADVHRVTNAQGAADALLALLVVLPPPDPTPVAPGYLSPCPPSAPSPSSSTSTAP